jgi:hypothetical protein
MESDYYVPILKGKDGEYGALKELPFEIKAGLTPLIEIPPIPWDFESETPTRTIDAHLKKVCEKISVSWGSAMAFFLDLLWLPDSDRMENGKHPLAFLSEGAEAKDLRLIPVTGLRRDRDYQIAAKAATEAHKKGACIRLENEDFEELTELNARLDSLLASLSLDRPQVDIVLDFRDIRPSQTATVGIAVRSILQIIRGIDEWRSVVLAATAFPPSLSVVLPSSTETLPRSEWSVWTSLAQNRSRLPRLPTFGDYGIQHPDPTEEIDPRVMTTSANIRYTTDTDWLIVKGKSIKKHGPEQSHGLCRTLIARAEYKGPTFSWGDQYIEECAGRSTNPGSPTTWRKVGTNHHLTLVVEQLANFA